MDVRKKIDTAQKLLKDNGNIIKTRDDRELLFIEANDGL